ncbi:hypothetical protein J6590_082669 [Homalodisca vitripennis]|nr:hypothetical protein J6590_082669 [Homalodisca vitripennis]
MDANEVPAPQPSGGKGVLPVLKHISDQTLPLFKPPFLKNLLLCVILMVDSCLCINTIFFWLPEITNRMAFYKESYEGDFSLCEMVTKRENITSSINTTSTQVESNATIKTAMTNRMAFYKESQGDFSLCEIMTKRENITSSINTTSAQVDINTIFLWLPEMTNRMAFYKESHEGDFSLCEMVTKRENLTSSLNTTSAPVECNATINTAVFIPNVLISLAQPIVMLAASVIVPLFDRRHILCEYN